MSKAASDLRSGSHQLLADPPDTGDAVFHAQQAAEKALKAFLAWHDVPFRRTRDLADIGRACADIDESLVALLREGAGLTQYAWRFRYPGEPEEPPLDEAQQALRLARQVIDAIASRLPAEARP